MNKKDGEVKESRGEATYLYRGLKMTKEALEQGYRAGTTVWLTGYTSTTADFDVARRFAFKGAEQTLNEVLKPVIFRIKFYGRIGRFEMTGEYSAYPYEGETLL